MDSKKLKLMCWVESEDFRYIQATVHKDEGLDHFGYTFEVEGAPESPAEDLLTLPVVELLNAGTAMGFCLPPSVSLTEQFEIGFISQDDPNSDLAVTVSLSTEVKKAQYGGNILEKLEYIGYTLEKFYQDKGVTFYLYNFNKDIESP